MKMCLKPKGEEKQPEVVPKQWKQADRKAREETEHREASNL
jgi:hypothetical protein